MCLNIINEVMLRKNWWILANFLKLQVSWCFRQKQIKTRRPTLQCDINQWNAGAMHRSTEMTVVLWGVLLAAAIRHTDITKCI